MDKKLLRVSGLVLLFAATFLTSILLTNTFLVGLIPRLGFPLLPMSLCEKYNYPPYSEQFRNISSVCPYGCYLDKHDPKSTEGPFDVISIPTCEGWQIKPPYSDNMFSPINKNRFNIKSVCKISDKSNLGQKNLSKISDIQAPYFFSLMGKVYKTYANTYVVEIDTPIIGTEVNQVKYNENTNSDFSLHLTKDGKVLADHKLNVTKCADFNEDMCSKFDTSEGGFILTAGGLSEAPDNLSFYEKSNKICDLPIGDSDLNILVQSTNF